MATTDQHHGGVDVAPMSPERSEANIMDKTKITRVTIGRLYNLGSYEHVRYELTVEIPDGESASKAVAGIERIFAALNPREPGSVQTETTILHDTRRVQDMKDRLAKSPEDFEQYYRGYVGTPEEYIARCEESLNESIAKREAWKARSRKARELLDDLGGAAKWHDAKLEWNDDDF